MPVALVPGWSIFPESRLPRAGIETRVESYHPLRSAMKMQPLCLLASALCAMSPAWCTGENPGKSALADLREAKRIVFLGDSITQAGDFITDIDCWLVSQGRSIEILNLGLGSETASDLTAEENAEHLKRHGFGRPFISERLARVLAATKPDIVFACYGMNDGGSLPADAAGDKRYADAITRLRETILKSGVKEVVLLTPPVRESKHGEWDKNGHDQSLTRYTEWLLSMKSKGWNVVDIHTPMRRALEAERVKNPEFGFTKDGVHPGREGHWVMARCVLEQFFGAKLDGVAGAEAIFPAQGDRLRALIHQRMKVRFEAWMTRVGHTRPGVPGGPGAKPRLTVEEAETKASELRGRLDELRNRLP